MAIALFQTALVFAQADTPVNNDPAWVYYEKGKYEMRQKEYGNAVYYFKQALSVARIMPEAELALGEVYFYEGDYRLAEQQYLRALEQKAAFSVPDMNYTVLYHLADLYEIWLKYGKMYEVLKTIVNDDTAFNDKKYALFRTNTVTLYENKGFDKMFTYNRLEETFSTEAHGRLAWYLYRTWNFETARDYALYSVIPILTECMLEIRRDGNDYRYTTLDDFFKTALAIDRVREYLEEKKIYERIYYLALISYEIIPLRDNGRSLLRILASLPEAETIQARAAGQLQNYRREARIDTRTIEK